MFVRGLRPVLLASAIATAPAAATAQIVTESGDAGETIATARVISGSVTQINGSLINLGSVDHPVDDIDLYRISIINPAAFGVTVTSSLMELDGPGFFEDDTELYLFNAAGAIIAFNDDSQVRDGTYAFSSPIFKVGSLAALTPGDYYLGFDLFYTRPIDANGLPFGQNLDLGWRRLPVNYEEGSYSLYLTGTSNQVTLPDGPGGPTGPGVPEPASWALMILGFGAAGAALRRQRSAIRAGLA